MGSLNIAYVLIGIVAGTFAILLGVINFRAMLTKVDRGPALKATMEIADAFQRAALAKSAQVLELEARLAAQEQIILKMRVDHHDEVVRLRADHDAEIARNRTELVTLQGEMVRLSQLLARKVLQLAEGGETTVTQTMTTTTPAHPDPPVDVSLIATTPVKRARKPRAKSVPEVSP